MYEMDQWNAPQWTDFTSSPQPLGEDYFDYEHTEHESCLNNDCEKLKASSSIISGLDKIDIESVPVISPKQTPDKTLTSKTLSEKADTEDEVNINLKTSVTVMPLTTKHNNSAIVNKTTYEDILVNAMSNLKLLSSKRKNRRSHNVSVYKQLSSTKVRSTKSIGIQPSQNLSCKKNIMKDLQMIHSTETEIVADTVADTVDESRNHDRTEVESTTKPVKSTITSNFNRGPVVANLRRSVANPTLLTCKYRRYSLSKNRRRSNQYISLAEAVNKFQNQTPKRFRTSKNMEPGPLAKTKQSLKITNPISPVLLSKTRVRSIATSNPDIRAKAIVSNEANQKNKCKANPVNIHTATASSVLPKKKIENLVPTSNPSQMPNKKRFNKITMPIIESDPSETCGFTIKNVEMSNFGVKAINMHKKSTCAVPFSFEAREKELRKKKAERLEKLEAEKENRKVVSTINKGATGAKLVPKNVHVAPPMLKTDKRAKERREFDEKLRQKECQQEETRRRLREERLAREKEEKALLRKMAEPKARPMPIYKPVAILKSNKPLTAPQSPAWAAKTKH